MPDLLLSHLIRAMAQMRARSKLTQTEVAALMGTTQTAIARLESGKQSPAVKTLQNYARANGYNLEIGFIAADPGAPTGCVIINDYGSANPEPDDR